MAPPAGLNQLKQSLMLKIESWFEELNFLVIRGWSCSWGVSLILYGGVNVCGGGASGLQDYLEAPTVLP